MRRGGSTDSFRSYSRSSSVASRADSHCSCLSCSAVGGAGRHRRVSRINAGVRVTDHYRFDEVLGEGTFSVVYLAESKSEPGGWAAVKVRKGAAFLSREN